MSTLNKFPVMKPQERHQSDWSGDTSSQEVQLEDLRYTTSPQEMVDAAKQIIADDERSGGLDRESSQNALARLESDYSKVKDRLSVPRSDDLDPPSAFAYTTKTLSMYGGGVMYFGITGGTSLRGDGKMTLHIGSLGTQGLFGMTHTNDISLDLLPRSFAKEARRFLDKSSESLSYNNANGPVNKHLLPLLRNELPSIFEGLLSTRAGVSGRLDILQRAPEDLCQVEDTTILLAENPEALSDHLCEHEQGYNRASCLIKVPNLVYPDPRAGWLGKSRDSITAFAITGNVVFSILEKLPSYIEDEGATRSRRSTSESETALDAEVYTCISLWPRNALKAESTQWYYRKPPAVKVPLASDWSESIKELVSKGHGFIDQNTIEGLKDPETVEALRWGLSLSLEDAVTRRQEFRVALSGQHLRGVPPHVSDTSTWTVGMRLDEASVFDPPVVHSPEAETE